MDWGTWPSPLLEVTGQRKHMQAAGQGKTWLEVVLNGPWTRKHQPRIPVTVKEIVEEGIACVKAGAANVHARL